MAKHQLIKIIVGCFVLLHAQLLFAQEKDKGQSLDQAANDPTASIMALQVQDIYTGSYHNLENEEGNSILLRAAVPFKTGKIDHITRATLPLITKSPSGETGMGDLTLFDLLVADRSWGRWGAGPVMLVPSATDDQLGSEKWAIGPAVGFIARSDKMMWGLFNQNLFSFAGDDDRTDVNVSVIQPIINYSLPNQWSIGTSEMNATYNWEDSEWSALPLGFKISKLLKLNKVPLQLSGAYEYNFADDAVGPEWTINFTFKFLFPI